MRPDFFCVLLLDMHVLLGERDFDAVLVQRVVDGA